MSRINLHDSFNKRYLSVELLLSYSLPQQDGGDLLCFEAFDERVKAFGQRQLGLGDFKVVTHKGFIVGVRSTLRAPRGLYPTIAAMQERIFGGFKDVIARVPARLNPHPLVHVIPDGYPGAGVIVVKNITGLVTGRGANAPAMSFVEQAAAGRAASRRALRDLGFTLKEGDG